MEWETLWRRLGAVLRARAGRKARIVAGAAGLSIEFPRRLVATRRFLDWNDIERVEAFKRDLLTTDLICLKVRAAERSIEVNEEMEGWDELVAQLPERLPGALSWEKLFLAVVKPAFAECRTVVFDRFA